MLFAVHLSDVLTMPWWVAGWVVAGLLFAGCARGIEEAEVPRIGVLAAAFFVASQVHLPLGGASVHLLLNGLVGVVLGRRSGIAIGVGVLLQTLLFGHGGLTTLGVNVVVLAVPALVAGECVRRLKPARLVRRRWARFTAVLAISSLWLITALLAAQWVYFKLTVGGALRPAEIHWWLTDPLVLLAVAGAVVVVSLLERRIESDPAFAFGLLLGAVTAYATVGLNALVLWAGGKPEVRDLAGVMVIAHLPVVAVESIGLGFLVADLSRTRPEWLSAQGPAGSGKTSSNGTSH
jgi:cobalt/nickel transport system permease protein